ncbi:MAG: thiamine ABC transporter substrate-binding protein [Fusobacteriaceae bacterium]
MKKKVFFIILLLISFKSFSETIVIYGPESMKWVEKVFKEDFKKETGDEIKFIGIKGLVTRLVLEKKNPRSDVVLGLTLISGELAKSQNLLTQFKPANSSLIHKEEFIMDKDYFITSFDYGVMGINYSVNAFSIPPRSFEDLANHSKKLLIQDPRSATGQEILLWSVALYGDKYLEFWKKLKPSILTTTSDWDDSFAKLTSGEASMMMGYATSNAFFYNEDKSKIQFDSFIPDEGGYIYLEGAALTNKKDIKDGAKKFIEFILSPNAQKLLVEHNYMLPVTNIEIPKEYKSIPIPKKIVTLDAKNAVINLELWKNQLIKLLKE